MPLWPGSWNIWKNYQHGDYPEMEEHDSLILSFSHLSSLSLSHLSLSVLRIFFSFLLSHFLLQSYKSQNSPLQNFRMFKFIEVLKFSPWGFSVLLPNCTAYLCYPKLTHLPLLWSSSFHSLLLCINLSLVLIYVQNLCILPWTVHKSPPAVLWILSYKSWFTNSLYVTASVSLPHTLWVFAIWLCLETTLNFSVDTTKKKNLSSKCLFSP